MRIIILAAMLLFGTGAATEVPPPWVILVYECDRPVGIILNTDPPRWFPASADLTPYIATQIRLAIESKRVTPLIVGQKCVDKRSV